MLETGNPVTMPWVDAPAAILEAWYAGSDGANAVGNMLFGTVNPSGKLPNTFPKSEADLPHPTVTMPPPESAHFNGPASPEKWATGLPPFPVAYDEGVKVGYKWYDAEKKPVLFPFGFGLSYTTYSYSGLQVTPGDEGEGDVHAGQHRRARRRGDCGSLRRTSRRRAGTAQAPRRIQQGEARTPARSRPSPSRSIRSTCRSSTNRKTTGPCIPGDYTIMVGGSSQDLPLKATINLK